jgi:hypothetical protein
MSAKANTLIVLGMTLPVITDTLSGSMSKEDKTVQQRKDLIKVIRSEKRYDKVGGKHHMRALSRGNNFYQPGRKIVGAYVTLEGPYPQDLRTAIMVQQALNKEAKRLGLFAPMHLIASQPMQSTSKADMWTVRWEIKG